MEFKAKEELNEILLELKRSQQREANLAIENRAILDAISAITGAQNRHQIFHELKRILALYIDFDDFVVLSKTQSDSEFRTFLTSNSAFVNVNWPVGEKFTRVLNGDRIILFEPTILSEFSHLNQFVKDQINAAIITGINTTISQSVILLLGQRKGQFPISSRDTLSRFEPLLERALIDIEHKESLQELVLIRTEELKLAREKAEEASKAKTQFLAMMSHELRTPLNSVLGLIDILECELVDRSQLETLSKIESSAELLLVLINDILDLTKIESGKFSTEYQWIKLREQLKKTLENYVSQAEKKGLDLKVDFDTIDRDLYWIDPTRLSQIVFNLVGNAIKFTTKGTISVSAKVQDKRLEIVIIDTGIGIENGRIPTLFSPFTQADSSITRKYGGTGLGLTITKHLVELMNGQIHVESTLGKGSCFTVLIPVNKKKQSSNAKKKTSIPDFSPEIENVLVVEDTKSNQMVIRLLLEKYGYNVTTLSNGREAVEYLKNDSFNKIDVVIMDISMPIMDGLTATKELRTFNETIPVIALTAHAMEKDKQDCLEAGMNMFVSKPIRRQEILQALYEVAKIQIN
ncbi:hybrid sensor histidine kinase/response regulator [Vibrio genomosp. F10 str. ZF-129]|uniref:histidine kinase n=2 Tax=Vibrio genomosp. F10 TaxID=723171 RepID=A0A1E5BGM1_9VIBR|nr:response regulator [Vibrio genomosp. F10]OEE34605.1 hybrid sensor histidine kinase/response regulator [Vibrio genomosp. F10 str. ZF-129]